MSSLYKNIGIRPLNPSDIEEVLQLWQASEGLGTSPGDSVDELSQFIERNPGCSLVAMDNDTVIGAVLCGHDGRRGYFYRLAVLDAYRGQGVATKMVSACAIRLREAGIVRAITFVLTENEAAFSFWNSFEGEVRHALRMLTIDLV